MPVKKKPKPKPKPDQIKYRHYGYSFAGVKLDPYRILSVYEITDPAIQHAIKKLLRCGRGDKDLATDIQEVIDTLKRKQEMMREDGGWFTLGEGEEEEEEMVRKATPPARK